MAAQSSTQLDSVLGMGQEVSGTQFCILYIVDTIYNLYSAHSKHMY